MELYERPEMLLDAEFEVRTLAQVKKSGNGYELHQDGGWVLWIDDPGFEPKAGEEARFYGRGFGFPVRGVVVGSQVAYYRTAAEDEQAYQDRTYPPTASEALARWDRGESLFTIALGGFGPGYEQCIHIAVFEVIRGVKDAGLADDQHLDAFRKTAERTITRIDDDLGMSGAQAGAAIGFAFRVLRDGWQRAILAAPDDRLIQVSKAWPHLRESSTSTSSDGR